MKHLNWFLCCLLLGLVLIGCSHKSERNPGPDSKKEVPKLDRELIGEEIQFGRKAAKFELWNEAIFRWEKVVKVDKSNVQALNNLAVAYEAVGDYEKAREHYEKALEIDEDITALRNNYKRFLHFYKRHMKNIERLEKLNNPPSDEAKKNEKATDDKKSEDEKSSDSSTKKSEEAGL